MELSPAASAKNIAVLIGSMTTKSITKNQNRSDFTTILAYEKSMTEVKFIYKNTIDMSLLEESTHSMQKLLSLPTLWSHYPAARGNGNAMVGPIPIGTNLPLSLIIRCIDLFCQYARAC